MSKPRSITELRHSLAATGMPGAQIDAYINALKGQPPEVVAAVLARDNDRSPNSRLRTALPNGNEKSVAFGETDDSGAVEIATEADDDVVENVCRREPNDDREIDNLPEMAGEFVGPLIRRCLEVARCSDKQGAKLMRLETLGASLGYQTEADAARNLGCTPANVAQGVKAWREWFGVEFRTLAAHSPEARQRMSEKARERWQRVRQKKTLPIASPPAAFESEPFESGFNNHSGQVKQSVEVAA